MEIKKKIIRALLILSSGLLLYLVYGLCKIDNLTHLSDSDLEWIDHYRCGDTLFFQNDNLQKDTMIVTDKGIHNSKKRLMNPFLKFETGGNYRAYSYLYFMINHSGNVYECSLFIFKEKNGHPPLIRWRLANDVSKSTFSVGELSCVIGDNDNSDYLDNHFAPKDRQDDIESFQWCKNQGLVWYRLKNGNTYRLISNP